MCFLAFRHVTAKAGEGTAFALQEYSQPGREGKREGERAGSNGRRAEGREEGKEESWKGRSRTSP